MGNWRHHSAPLRLRACRKKNHKTCEDDLADHGSHLTARRAKPGPNNLAHLHLQGCAQPPIGFKSNSFSSLEFPASRLQPTPFKQENCFSCPLPTTRCSLPTIPSPLFPPTVL